MGRKVKRVPIDFGHPIGEIWPGFLNEHYQKCLNCDGTSYLPAHRELERWVHELMWRRDNLLDDVSSGLAGREKMRGLLGHDSIDSWSATKKILAAAGLPEDWGLCPECDGEGVSRRGGGVCDRGVKRGPDERGVQGIEQR